MNKKQWIDADTLKTKKFTFNSEIIKTLERFSKEWDIRFSTTQDLLNWLIKNYGELIENEKDIKEALYQGVE